MSKTFRLIMGRNCIEEVLKASPQRLAFVYTSQKGESDDLIRALQEQDIPVKPRPKHELSRMVESESHQGFVAAIKETNQPTLKDFLQSAFEKETSLVVMLDSIFDPQNLGAIIRAAECFGADLVVFSRNRGADITPVATKTSVGATELVPILKVSNLTETLKAFQKEGYTAIAAEAKEHSEDLHRYDVPNKVVLVLGSEGKGIQPLLSKTCDAHLIIPMYGSIDSLNVSQAAAVFLSHFRARLLDK